MDDMATDRVYDERAGRQVLYAATGRGVAVVEASGDTIGRFRLAHECAARDLCGGHDLVAVATDEDVLVCEDASADEEAWTATGFGPAVAVGFDGDDLLAAGPDGELGRMLDAGTDLGEWLSVADVDGAVRAIDGPLVGASDGVYRFDPDGIVDVGLDDVRDVSAAGVPLAATGAGLFRLGNGWLRELDGPIDVVAGTDQPPATAVTVPESDALACGHAAAGEQFYEYHGEEADRESHAEESDRESHGEEADGESQPVERDRESNREEGERAGSGSGTEIVDPAVAARAWRERDTPAGPVVAVAYGERTYAMAADGTVLLDRGDGWESRSLGLPDATALATPD